MRGELFTLEDREWVAQNAVKTIENRMNGSSYRIVDFPKLIVYIRQKRFNKGLSPQISIMPISEDKFKARSYSFNTFNDKERGVIYGKFLGFADNGNPRYKRFIIGDAVDLDISNQDDAELWALLCFYPKLEGSVNEESPYYKVYDKSKEAISNNVKAEEFMQASGRIKSMSLKDKVYFLRYAYPSRGVLSNYNEEIVNGILFDELFKNPQGFNRKFVSKSRSVNEAFTTAIELGVIMNIPEKGYLYDNLNIGSTEMDAIAFLSKDNVIFGSILDKIGREDTILSNVSNNTSNLNKENASVKQSEKKDKKPEPIASNVGDSGPGEASPGEWS